MLPADLSACVHVLSIQDTVIGLQALAEFAKLIYTDGIQASVTVSEKDSQQTVAQFEVTNDNSFVEFSQSIPNVTDLTVQANGKGCFMFQVLLSKNTCYIAMLYPTLSFVISQ